MINIVFFVTPNYTKNKNQINVIYKKIDLLDQFFMAYYSIKKNWKITKYEALVTLLCRPQLHIVPWVCITSDRIYRCIQNVSVHSNTIVLCR